MKCDDAKSLTFILSKKAFFHGNGWNCLENFHLGIADAFTSLWSVGMFWSFHGENGQYLQEMVLHNVSDDSKIICVRRID